MFSFPDDFHFVAQSYLYDLGSMMGGCFFKFRIDDKIRGTEYILRDIFVINRSRRPGKIGGGGNDGPVEPGDQVFAKIVLRGKE